MKIERKFNATLKGWEYTDPAVNAAALDLAGTIGFNLAEFDTWLLAADPPFADGAAEQIMVCRQRLLAATITGNSEAMQGWANYLHLLRVHNLREVSLHPKLLRDKATQAGRSKGGKNKRPKLPKADDLRAELAALQAARGLSKAEAVGVLAGRHKVTRQAVNAKLKKDLKPT